MSITEPEDAAVDVGGWLRNLGLEQYEAAFRENGVGAEVLRHLTADDLKELGVAAVGHRRQLMVAIAELRDRAPSAARLAENQLALPSSGERRQLTVMFCDLVGSTALSERLDPEELGKLLHAYRTLCGDVIARYDGFVARYVGDGILTYFGWPSAHEEDAERAVRAALEIVQTVKRASSTEDLSVRIGIATGPVVVGEQAGSGDQSKLAVGSTPNLAARLQALATTDQVVIAVSTRRLVGNAFELSDLGEHDLKGIAEPVHAWRVEHALATESRFDANRGASALTPLVGREGEVDLLLRRWSQAKDGEGQVVLLSGEPGIGKSRILDALRERLGAQGVQALRFQCSPYYVNSAFWPVIDNFERALKFTRDETINAKLDKLEALTRDRQEPYPDCSARAARSARRAGAALPVLALLREQRLLAGHRQLRTGVEVRPRRNCRRETRQAGSADSCALRPANSRRPVRRCDLVDPLRAALRGFVDDAAEAQGRDTADPGRHHRSGRPQATKRVAVRGCTLGRSHHAGGVGSADRPRQSRAAAGRAHPPAGVSIALVRAGACRGIEPYLEETSELAPLLAEFLHQ